MEQAAAGEQRRRAGAVPHEERLVVLGVAGGVQHLEGEPAHLDDVTAADAHVRDGDQLRGGDEVVGAVPPREQRGARDVVVVDVGVGDRPDLDAGLVRRALDHGGVARGVDDDALAAVVQQVAAVAELGEGDGDDLHGHSCQRRVDLVIQLS